MFVRGKRLWMANGLLDAACAAACCMPLRASFRTQPASNPSSTPSHPASCTIAACRVDMRSIEVTIQNLIGSGLDPRLENNPYLTFVYTSFQVTDWLGGAEEGQKGGGRRCTACMQQAAAAGPWRPTDMEELTSVAPHTSMHACSAAWCVWSMHGRSLTPAPTPSHPPPPPHAHTTGARHQDQPRQHCAPGQPARRHTAG